MNKIAFLGALLLLTACGVESYSGSVPYKETDKHLNCQQLLLELNDARFWQEQAKENKGLNFRNIVWPVGYPWTYNSAEEAIAMTQERIDYLNNIYNIKGCNKPYADMPNPVAPGAAY